MSVPPEQRRQILFRVRPDPAVIRARARERQRRYRAGKTRIDFFRTEQSVAAINSLLTPHIRASTVINRVIAEWVAHRPDAGGRDLQAADPDSARSSAAGKQSKAPPAGSYEAWGEVCREALSRRDQNL